MFKVLLVEDEAFIRNGLKKMVEGLVHGFKVTAEAKDGEEALEFMKRDIPDLMITDIRMPRMDGLSLIQRIKEHHFSFPIVIISGHGEFEYAKRALRFQVMDYLLKPIDRVELAKLLEKLKQELTERKNNELPEGEAISKHPDGEQEVHDKLRTIRQVKQIVQENLGEGLSLQSVAEQVHLHYKYVSVLFKAETGENFSDYVQKLRIHKAKTLLNETNLKMYEIAEICGFGTQRHFMSAFKQATGMTTRVFRNQK
jgi:two-component system response regulator YesN